TEKIRKAKSVDEALEAFLTTRLTVIKDNFNLFEFTYTLRNEIPSDIESVLPSLFEKEIHQVRLILEKGIDTEEINVDDIELTAKILLILLLGMRIGILQEFRNIFLPPTKEEYDYILDLQKKLGKIFINGLRV